eukprot:gene19004-20916_t
MYVAGIFVAALVLALFGDANGCEADNHVNGCSIPYDMPFAYKNDFTPACHKHDVCYYCGNKYGWTRSKCDIAFYKDMIAICQAKYGGKKRFLTDFVNGLHVVHEVAKIPFISNKRDQCAQAAKVYYLAVDYFGQSSYNRNSPSWCNDSCALAKGNPN